MKRNTKRHDLEKPYQAHDLASALTKAHGLDTAFNLAKEQVKLTGGVTKENMAGNPLFGFWFQVANILRKQKEAKKAG